MSAAGDFLLARMQDLVIPPPRSFDDQARVVGAGKVDAADRPVVSPGPDPVSYLEGHLVSPCLCVCH